MTLNEMIMVMVVVGCDNKNNNKKFRTRKQ
jgi:uncharacterized lipoprotein YehR (DUF1307 family)